MFRENVLSDNPIEFILDNRVLDKRIITDLKSKIGDLKAENQTLRDMLQKNGLEVPYIGDNSIFQSQTPIDAVEMQEAINKEIFKLNVKHSTVCVENNQEQEQHGVFENIVERVPVSEGKP